MRHATVLSSFSVMAGILGLSFAAGAAGPANLPTGIYSSLAASERSGDFVGLEIFVLQGATGHFAVIQGSEGAPGDPITVPLQVNGNAVRFSIPGRCACALPEGIYEAQLSQNRATLRGPGTFGERQLPRRNSFWQGGQ